MNKIVCLFFILVFFKTEAQTSVLKIADSLYTYGKYTKAIKKYKKLESSIYVSNKIAQAYQEIGDYDKALSYYISVINQQISKLQSEKFNKTKN